MDRAELEERLSAAFHGGERRSREVRLSPEEAAYAAARYPAQVVPTGGGWYQISFGGMRDG